MSEAEGVSEMWRRVNRAVGALCCLVLTAAFAAACSSEEPAPLPGKWSALDPPSLQGSIELRADGTGTFDKVPLWRGGTCEASNSAPYSGEVRWTKRKEQFVVQSPASEIVIAPDTGILGSLNWDKLVVEICGPTSPANRLIVYGSDLGGPSVG